MGAITVLPAIIRTRGTIMTQSVEEIVVGLISRQKGLDPATLTLSAGLAELGMTSLDAITLAYELEETFGVDIPNADIDKLRTVQDLIDGLERLITAKA
jgi:acyl carrier protein